MDYFDRGIGAVSVKDISTHYVGETGEITFMAGCTVNIHLTGRNPDTPFGPKIKIGFAFDCSPSSTIEEMEKLAIARAIGILKRAATEQPEILFDKMEQDRREIALNELT